MTLALVGATASGKTAVAVALAQLINAEIVSADSVQVYKQLNTGSAKPTAQEQAQAVFHGIDVVNPDEDWTLAQHQQMGSAAFQDIIGRGRVPFVVGGTGLYVRALTSPLGIPSVPPNAEFRERWQLFAQQHGNAALHDKLFAVDPDAAERLHVNDIGRHIRALEVLDATGVPLSEWHRRDRAGREGEAPRGPHPAFGTLLPSKRAKGQLPMAAVLRTLGQDAEIDSDKPFPRSDGGEVPKAERGPLAEVAKPERGPLSYPRTPANTTRIFGLHFPDRRVLYERIEQRVDAMLAAGFVDEVRGLLSRGYGPNLKSMSSLGYRHVCAFLSGDMSLDAAVDMLKRDTRRFARRQLVWFRADPRIVWVNADGKGEDELAHIIAAQIS